MSDNIHDRINQDEIAVQNAIDTLKANGYILNPLWHKLDIMNIAKNDYNTDLTKEEVDEVAEILENLDSDVAVTWESIDIAVSDVIHNRQVRKKLG